MRPAYVVTSEYSATAQLPRLGFAGANGQLVRARTGLSRPQFEVRAIAGDRELPARLAKEISCGESREALLFYYSGYAAVDHDRKPGLVLDGTPPSLLPLSRLRTLLLPSATRILAWLDVFVVPGSSDDPRDLVASTTDALWEPDGCIATLVAANSRVPATQPASPATELACTVWEWLQATRSSCDDRSLFEAMQRERIHFSRVSAISYNPAHQPVVLSEPLPDRQTSASNPGAALRAELPTSYSLLGNPAPAPPDAPAGQAAQGSGKSSASPAAPQVVSPALEREQPGADAEESMPPSTKRHSLSAQEVALLDREADLVEMLDEEPSLDGPGGCRRPLEAGTQRDPGASLDAPRIAPGASPAPPVPQQSDSADMDHTLVNAAPAPAVAAPEVGGDSAVTAEGVAPPGEWFAGAPSVEQASAPTSASLHSDPGPKSVPPSIPSAAWSGVSALSVDEAAELVRVGERARQASEDPDADALPADALLRVVADDLHPRAKRDQRALAGAGAHDRRTDARPASLPPPPRPLSALPPPPPRARRFATNPAGRGLYEPDVVGTPLANGEEMPLSVRELSANIDAHWDAGLRRLEAGDPLTARNHFERAIQLGIDGPERVARAHALLGSAARVQGDQEAALNALATAMELNPTDEYGFELLTKLLREARLDERLVRAANARLDNESGEDERVALLDLLAEAALEEGADEDAAHWLEQRLRISIAIQPLELAAEAHRRLGDWLGVIDTQEALASHFATVPDRAALALEMAARVADEQLDDRERCAQLLIRACETTPWNRERFERAVDTLTRHASWEHLVNLGQMVSQLCSEESLIVSATLRASQACRRGLENDNRAAHIVSDAVHRAPNSATLREELADLYRRHAAPDLAEAQARAALQLDPLSVRALSLVGASLLDQSSHDRAWYALSAAAHLGTLEPELSEYVTLRNPSTLSVPSEPFAAEAWRTIQLETDHPHLVEAIDAASAGIVRAKLSARGRRERGPLGECQRLDLETDSTELAYCVLWSARLLGIEAPGLWVHDGTQGDLAIAAEPGPNLLVRRTLAGDLDPLDLVFLTARHLVMTVPSLLPLSCYGDSKELAAMLRRVLSAVGIPGAAAGVSTKRRTQNELRRALSDDNCARLVKAGPHVLDGQLVLGIERLRHCMALEAGRAGLVACGDPARALRLAERFTLPWLPLRDQLIDLTQFCTSEAYHQLRERLGLAPAPLT